MPVSHVNITIDLNGYMINHTGDNEDSGVDNGVGDYANDQLNLKYTVNDAEAISKAMELGAENLFV